MQPNAALFLVVVTVAAIADIVSTHAKADLTVSAAASPAKTFNNTPGGMVLEEGNSAHKDKEEERGFGNVVLSKLKNAFKKAPPPQLKQVKVWIKEKETPDGVFKLLTLDEGVNALLDSQKLQLWGSYVTWYNWKHPGNEVNMLELFTKTYGGNLVAKTLERAVETPRTHVYATTLQNEVWMLEKKTPAQIFKVLKLDENLDTLLDNSNLQRWGYFAERYNEKNPENAVNMLGMFTKAYGDAALAKMFETATHNPSTQLLAAGFQEEQMAAWVTNGLSTDVVFKMLKLDEGSVEGLLANPALSVWCKYFTNLNQYNADKSVTMIKKLLATYEDIPLATAIMAATKDNKPQTIAATLQEAQFQKWLLDGKTPNAISKTILKDRASWKHHDIVQAYNTFYQDRL